MVSVWGKHHPRKSTQTIINNLLSHIVNHIGYCNFEDKYGCTYNKGPIIIYQMPTHKATDGPYWIFLLLCIYAKDFSIIIIISMMDLNKLKFFNIVKLLMSHVQKSDILLIILFPHVTCQHIYDCFRRYCTWINYVLVYCEHSWLKYVLFMWTVIT